MAKEKYIGEALLKDKPTIPLSFKFKEKSVKTKHIDDKAVTNGQIDDNAVTERTILDSNVTNSKIANGAVTSGKIGTGEVKNSNIGSGQVTSDKIGTGEVKTANIDSKAVTTAKIDDGAVGTVQIGNRAVTSGKIGLQEVKTENIKDQNVTTPKLADGNVTWGKLSQSAKNSISDMVDDAAEVITRRLMRDVNTIMADYRPIEVRGDVTNAADEEDLTSVNVGGTEVIRLKDKEYVPTIYSGLGKKYMRKNMVRGVNILTQSMMPTVTGDNTIYVIQYDYDLDGEEVTVPEGCTLEFDGGSLNNGTLVCDQTTLKGNVRFNRLLVSGSITNIEIDVAWFGVDGQDSSAQSNDEIFSTYLLPSCNNLKKTLVISKTIPISAPISISQFNLNCLFYFKWVGAQDLNGAVVTLSGTLRNHSVNVYNASYSGTFDVRKELPIIGVDCNNLNNSTVYIGDVYEFTTGVRVSATSGGNAYNTYNINKIRCCYKNLLLYRTEGTWVNENTFNGGRMFSESQSVWSTINDGQNRAISFEASGIITTAGNHTFNNLVFNKPCCEGAYVCIYSNSAIGDSVINNIRNEGAITLIQEEASIPISKIEYKCVVTPYRYVSYKNTVFRTFVVESATDIYSTYKFDTSALIYRVDGVDGIGIGLSNLLVQYITLTTGLFTYGQNTVADIPITSNFLNCSRPLGLLFEKNPNRSYIYGYISITGPASVNVSGVERTNNGVRVGIALMDSNFICLQNDTSTGINEFADIISSYNFSLTTFSTGSKYRYYRTGSDLFSATFSLSNLPDKVKYIFIFITAVSTESYVRSFSSATLSISNTVTPAIQPTGQFRAGNKITRYCNLPEDLTVVYRNLSNKLCIASPSNGDIVTTVIDHYTGTFTEAQALITDNSLKATDQGVEFYATDLKKSLYLRSYQDTGTTQSVAKGTTLYIENFFDAFHIYRMSKSAGSPRAYYSTTNDDTGTTVELPALVNFEAYGADRYPYIKLVNPDRSYSRSFTFYPILAKWLESDSATAGVSRSGDTASRPVGSDIYVGFMYMDTEVGKPIYAETINDDTVTWVDANGETA